MLRELSVERQTKAVIFILGVIISQDFRNLIKWFRKCEGDFYIFMTKSRNGGK